MLSIRDLSVLARDLPPRALGLVMEWAALRQPELRVAWAKARKLEPLDRIDPLDQPERGGDMLFRITAVEGRFDHRLWVRFVDGTEGEVDLSDIVGRGVFRRWTDHPEEFFDMRVDPLSGAPTWPGGLEIAPDRLHEELVAASGTGNSPV